MKYVEFLAYFDDNGKELTDERRDQRMVDISEHDAEQMNTPNQHGDGQLRYRKATDADIKKFSQPAKETKTEEVMTPGGTIEDKTYDEWTVKDLKKLAKDEGIELEATAKPGIWEELIDALAPID